jgi:hypothetical protein
LNPTREEGREAEREKMEKRPVVEEEEDYKDEEREEDDVGGKGKEKVSSAVTRRNSREESAYQPSPKLSSSRRSVGCPICFEPIRDPRLLRVCGHTFCYGTPPPNLSSSILLRETSDSLAAAHVIQDCLKRAHFKDKQEGTLHRSR